jgi:hypothetical protein
VSKAPLAQVERDRNARALALAHDTTFKAAVDHLIDRATKEVLDAKTPEEREEKWRTYDALRRVSGLIAIWAAEARTNP